ILEEAKKSDCCFHAGDFISYDVFRKLASLTKTYGVCGNIDGRDICEKLPLKQIIPFEGVRLGLIHGRGSPTNLINYICGEFSGEVSSLAMVVYGHSHFAAEQEIDGTIFFNPGSPTDKIFSPYRSYGILEISGMHIQRRIIKIE
ncbi:MAG: metallophosphatase family protein, partial [Candidatus Omnitrophica bacterium]|nr:metallophosphatase family protein [Candidatus Omnitrophota bacterium]